MSTVSKHANERIRERAGINKKSANRQFELAKERGLYQKDVKGRLSKWVTYTCIHNENKLGGIVYNNNLFLYNVKQDKLVTVIEVPSHLKKLIPKKNKK